MAGFLTHIATRIGGSAQMLRPRIASLFEPAPIVDPDVAGVPNPFSDAPSLASAFERVEERNAPVAAKPSPSTVAFAPAQRDTSAPIGAGEPTAGGHDAAPASGVTREDPPSNAKLRKGRRLPEPSRETQASALARTEPDAPISLDVATSRTARIVVTDRPSAAPHFPPVDASDARPERAREGIFPTRPKRSTAPLSTSVQESVEVASRAIDPAPNARGILQAPAVSRIVTAPPTAAQRASPAEPTIHIAIGRVEVRAVAAPPSEAARAERPAPVMSLDEYLRTRTT